MSPRQTALKNGDKTYEGALCKHGHGTKRYTKTRACVVCKKMYDKNWKTSDPVRYQKAKTKKHLKFTYNMTSDDWLWMYKEQGGKCNIEGCEKTSHNRWWDQGKLDGLVVDHCHKTGRVRGLICTPHNTLIGWIEKLGYTTLNALSPTMEYLK